MSLRTLYQPEPADVIAYGYLWAYESDNGQVIGLKDRPCLVLAVADEVVVLPITSQESDQAAVMLPERTRNRFGLKYPSWVVIDEYNAFKWRGEDVVTTADGQEYYGAAPAKYFEAVKEQFLQLDGSRRVPR